VPQDQINEIIVNLAESGRHIVRLKGGDPYLFGRGGEEALTLKQHNIEFEVVPGITAASGCSAYSGIPLTHRGMSRSVKFITGHFSNDEPLNIDWQKAADPDCTLVIYMGLANLVHICKSLIDAGLSVSTPAVAIENGTTGEQQRVLSQLGQLPAAVNKRDLKAPVMIIIGDVVTLADELDWFQQGLEKTEYEQNSAAHS
jgi:uroporphyrin-III C-methyltransferase/precorrin-2 dehydrogenase/sirohydrochlorin ferrochelatase/uroporphyrin-III C-methyltransferase